MGEKRLIEVADLTRLSHVEDPQISPDGAWIVYTQVTPNREANQYFSNLWAVNVHTGASHQLTFSNKDKLARWSPDGKTLAFVSSRSGTAQIYLLSVEAFGGEARVLTTHPNGVIFAPSWSPNGEKIAFTARANALERRKETDPTLTEEAKDYFDPLVVAHIPYREGTSYRDDRTTQIYVIDAQIGAKARRLTNQDADYSVPVWSNESNRLYTLRIHALGGDEYWRKGNVFSIDLITGNEIALLDHAYTLEGLSVSPDGKWLAFARRDGDDSVSQFEFVVMANNGTAQTVLNASFDRPVEAHTWTADSTLVLVAQNQGRTDIYHATPQGEIHLLVAPDLLVTGVSSAKNGGLAFVASHYLAPSDVYYCAPQTTDMRPLTRINAAFLDSVFVQTPHELRYASAEGEIQGWYLLPPNYEAGNSYPLALNIHGGPHVMWSLHDRSMWHEWQLHASQGYVVFFCNPRGSSGYGNSFQRALGSEWGERAMQDILSGVHLLIERGIVDAERMAITGGSYGGYMTAWIIAHTNAFKVAVSQRGVYNLVSFYGTTDIPSFAQSQFGVAPWEDHAFLWERSPLAYVANIQTPLLIIHSEKDFRVAIEQGEQLFMALHRLEKPVRMVRFPREGHELSRSGEPEHRMRRLQEMVDWWNGVIFGR